MSIKNTLYFTHKLLEPRRSVKTLENIVYAFDFVLIDKMKRLSQSGSSNFSPELRRNALLIRQSYFSNFTFHMINGVIKDLGRLIVSESFINFHPNLKLLTAVVY